MLSLNERRLSLLRSPFANLHQKPRRGVRVRTFVCQEHNDWMAEIPGYLGLLSNGCFTKDFYPIVTLRSNEHDPKLQSLVSLLNVQHQHLHFEFYHKTITLITHQSFNLV